MDEATPKGKSILSKVSGKLAVLIGGGLAILNGNPKLDAKIVTPDLSQGITTQALSGLRKTLPAKLTLRQVGDSYKIIAQHESHSSHDSHASHDSHSSHDSHASHASHTSGGFV
jgi:hypothetical protein